MSYCWCGWYGRDCGCFWWHKSKYLNIITIKYKTDLYLFINELDIKAVNSIPGDFSSSSSRKIIVHYTIYTYDAKEINSGIAEVNMPSNVNNPSKIINSYFSLVAETITNRLLKALTVK